MATPSTPASRIRHADDSIIIVGAGVFGLSTAAELSSRGYKNITVIDRYPPPVPDGSSVDISRIIRTDYADPIYSRMATEAQALWQTEYSAEYSQCGFVLLSDTPNHPYIAECKQNLTNASQPFISLDNGNNAKKDYPALSGDLSKTTGYSNAAGGWANAGAAIEKLAVKCAQAGVSFVTGPRGTVTQLLREGNHIRGVNVVSGPPLTADHIILATGAWTSSLIPTYESVIATGQPVGFIQLTPTEAERLQHLPVCINLSTGFFIFPPTPDSNILKVARHGFGYENSMTIKYPPAQPSMPSLEKTTSSPPRDTNGSNSSFIPADADKALRAGLAQVLPEFADRTWARTRLCWYTDTPRGDFIIDNHPQVEGLFLATGGSGQYVIISTFPGACTLVFCASCHYTNGCSAFKFLPVLGKYIADCFEDIAPNALREKWSYENAMNGTPSRGDGSRGGPMRRILDTAERAKL